MNNEFGNLLEGAVFICFGTRAQLSPGRTDARYGNARQKSLFSRPRVEPCVSVIDFSCVALSLNMDK
jgi:hypothetical protein